MQGIFKAKKAKKILVANFVVAEDTLRRIFEIQPFHTTLQKSHWILAKYSDTSAIKLLESFKKWVIYKNTLPDNFLPPINLYIKKFQVDFADASLVVLAEHINLGYILTVDRRDFNRLKWGKNKSFVNLLDLV